MRSRQPIAAAAAAAACLSQQATTGAAAATSTQRERFAAAALAAAAAAAAAATASPGAASPLPTLDASNRVLFRHLDDHWPMAGLEISDETLGAPIHGAHRVQGKHQAAPLTSACPLSTLEPSDHHPTTAITTVPSCVRVICGGMRGLMTLPEHRILVFQPGAAGAPLEMPPTEFERMGGRGSHKRWRSSIRVADAGDERWAGCAIGDWLVVNGFDDPQPMVPRRIKRKTSNGTVDGTASGGSCEEAAPATGSSDEHVPNNAAAGQQRDSSGPDDVITHAAIHRLADACISSQATLTGATPRQLPGSAAPGSCPEAGADLLLLKILTKEHLLREAAAAALQASGAGSRRTSETQWQQRQMLPHAAPKPQPLPGDGSTAVAAMADYLAGVTNTLPSRGLPLEAAVPLVCGHTLDLRALFRAVVERGGHLWVTLVGRWGEVLQQLGLDGGEDQQAVVQALYERVLLRFERMYDPVAWLQATGRPSPIATAAAKPVMLGAADASTPLAVLLQRLGSQGAAPRMACR